MKPQVSCFLAIIAALLLLSPLAAQSDLYDNRLTDGYTLGWTINFGFAVSDQFTLTTTSTVENLTFAAWLFPGDVLENAEVSITSSEFGGTSYFDGTVNFTASGCFSNGGFNVCNETGSLGYVGLYSGTYWLNLQNGVVYSGDPVYWDQNSGPSLASQSSIGTIPSESFTILGTSGCGAGQNAPDCGPPPPTTPEPQSLLLLGTGMAAVVAFASRFRTPH